MQVSQDVVNYGMLSELAYLKLENYTYGLSDRTKLENFIKSSASGIDDDRKTAILSLLDTYTIVNFTTTPSGMQAMLLRDGSGKLTVAFRGTETSDWSELKKDVGSDAEMAIGHEIPQMRDALAYVQMLKTTGVTDPVTHNIVKINASTVLTGHSLGGALAQYVAFKTGYTTYTYNGFGIRKGEGIIGAGGDASYIHNFHLGVDFVSGIGSRIGGQPGGQVFETTRDVLRFIPGYAVAKIVASLVSLTSAASINATIDNITGSFIGKVTNITPYDSSSLGDYGQDHSIVEMNKALHLYQTYLSPIFGSDVVETINLEMASIAALPYEYIAQSPYRVLSSTNGMPKVLELMGYALLGKPMSNGSRYDTYANSEAFLTQLKSAVVTNGGIKVLAFDYDSPDALFNAARGSKAIQYDLVNNLPLIMYKNSNAPLYANFDGSYLSQKELKDMAAMAYYMEHPKAGNGIGTVYINQATGVTVFDKEAAINKVIFGKNSDGNETLQGLSGDDRLYGNAGDDTLIGDSSSVYLPQKGADYMEGGTGYDKYIANNGDIIMDSDQNGVVAFEGFKLTGGVSETGCKPNGDGEYRGDGGVYKLSSGKLTFTKDGTNETLTIEKFVNGALGIILTSKDPGASCPPPPPPPPEPDDRPEPNPNFPSPLVLDLNGDGITSTFISSTSTYFDLDNDGVKQRTGWVQTTDALLVLDKNQDGIINNASELFGNHTTLKNGTKAANGFEALKEYDENKDGLIDAKDNIYNTLSLWQDSNSDGVTDTGELHTLTELGVKSINLDYTQTTDYEEQNRIFQSSSFTMSRHSVPDTESQILNQVQDDEVHTINDVWFATESRDTARDTTVTLKETVAALPDFRGAGRVENLSVAMNEIKIERKVA